jgi:FecR-like protein
MLPVALLMRALLVLAALHAVHDLASAQVGSIEARVSSVRGHALISRQASAPSDIARGVIVEPGDQIDTRAGGRVAVELGDGSLVIVQPGSLVVVRDYRNASSVRELLQIMVGRVRVRINHLGGRPNPYRINSPTASIAVRGTELSVAVEPRGDTQVVVYEGVVEVSSFTNPRHPVLVQPGHGVIVRPNEDIQFFVPGPNTEMGARSNGKGDDGDDTSENVAGSAGSEESLRSAAGVHERYFQSIVESGELPLPSRFTAFPDSFFDSIENPAYAAEFKTTQGRFFMVPSVGGTHDKEGARQLLGFGDSRAVDYSVSPQASVFVALPKYRAVIGGRVAFSRDGLQSLTLDDNVRLTGSLFPGGTSGRRSIDGSTKNRLFTMSLVGARRFGSDGRTSIGVGLDYLNTTGSLFNTTIQTDAAGLTSRELVDTGSFAKRTRFTFGVNRELSSGTKLGLFYRYGFVTAEDRDRSRTLNGANRLLNRTTVTGRSSEIGLRIRGGITRRLFYGVEGSYLFTNNDGQTRRAKVVDSDVFAGSTRATIGLGLGYVPWRGTVLSLDVAGGITRINGRRIERATSNLLQTEKERAPFISLHAALQADVWRRSFLSASVLSVTETHVADLALFPDRFGRRVTDDGMFMPNGQTRQRFTDYFGNFGVGWRFNRNFLTEYIFSTDFGQTSPRHTLMLRYTFSRGEENVSK